MAYNLEEQEQIAGLKAWWEKYGNLVLTLVTLVLLSVAGWNFWGLDERREAMAAAAIYDGFTKAVDAKDAPLQKQVAGTLIEKHGGTIYAALAALQVARLNHDAADFPAARTQLRWVLDKSGQAELAAIARLRLAAVLLDEKSYDEALALLSGATPAEHAAAFADRRGDVLLAMGKPAEARTAWQQAIDAAGAQHPLRAIIQLKLDALPVS
jgi:predicted negative regulator of RcsB-dependent stress response